MVGLIRNVLRLSSVKQCLLDNGRPLASLNNLKIHSSASHSILDSRHSRTPKMKIDEGTEGEGTINIDSIIRSRNVFPTEQTADTLFDGVPFSKIPICNIHASKNNTTITITDPVSGNVKVIRSCGVEGFKNTRKGTNVAAQATAISFGNMAITKGFNTVRLRVKGLGPGRMSSVKGLQMAGMNIISITDCTPVSWNPPRPRKQRRL